MTRRRGMIASMALATASLMAAGGQPVEITMPREMLGFGKRMRRSMRPTPRRRNGPDHWSRKHIPKSQRLRASVPKKPELLLNKRESSFQLAHRLPGGILMQPWQVKACLSRYSGETPESFA